MKAESLYAAAGAFAERGGMPYWLLKPIGKPHKWTQRYRPKGVPSIKKGTWVATCRWYQILAVMK